MSDKLPACRAVINCQLAEGRKYLACIVKSYIGATSWQLVGQLELSRKRGSLKRNRIVFSLRNSNCDWPA